MSGNRPKAKSADDLGRGSVYSMKEFGFAKQFFRGEGCPNRILLIALVS
jgi:hypothetical protein